MISVNISVDFALKQIINLSHRKLLWTILWDKISKYLENMLTGLMGLRITKGTGICLHNLESAVQNRIFLHMCYETTDCGKSGRTFTMPKHFLISKESQLFWSLTLYNNKMTNFPVLIHIIYYVHSLIPQRYD